MKRAILVCLVVFCLGGTVFAQYAEDVVRNRNVYLGLGGFFPSGGFSDIGVDLETGVAFEGGFQNYFNNNIGIGLSLTLTSADTAKETVGIGGSNVDMEGTFTTVGFGVSLLARYPMEKLDIYGGLGVGLFFNAYEAKVSSVSVDIEDNGTTFGFHLEAGARYNLTDNFFFGAALKYIVNEQETSGSDNYDFGGTAFMVTGGVNF